MTGLYIFSFLATIPLIFGGNVHEMEVLRETSGISWKSCNTTVVPVVFSTLSIHPNPIVYGHNIELSFALAVTGTIGTSKTLQVDIDAEMIAGGQRFNMCSTYPKYCHLKNLCETIAKYTDICPEEVQKIVPCHCPLKQNTYMVNGATIPIPSTHVRINGKFNVTINLSEFGNPVGCVSVEFCLGYCPSMTGI